MSTFTQEEQMELAEKRVGMILTPKAEKSLTERKAVISRLLLARIKSKKCNISVIVCYAPTNESPDEIKD